MKLPTFPGWCRHEAAQFPIVLLGNLSVTEEAIAVYFSQNQNCSQKAQSTDGKLWGLVPGLSQLCVGALGAIPHTGSTRAQEPGLTSGAPS